MGWQKAFARASWAPLLMLLCAAVVAAASGVWWLVVFAVPAAALAFVVGGVWNKLLPPDDPKPTVADMNTERRTRVQAARREGRL